MKSSPALFVLLAALAAVSFARATMVIYPVGAIDDFWALPADEFRQKYGGINATGLGPSDEGWYVRYRHENLTYLFGPLADREEARKKKWDMEAVRDAAIRNRPTLSTSQVDFVRFTFSGVYGRGGDGTGGLGDLARVSADGKSGPDGDLDGDGIPNSMDDDMDGDGVPNDKDDDVDGDGVPNGSDDYAYGTMDAKLRAGIGLGRVSADGKSGPDGDLDGDGIANAKDKDMDGDGLANEQDSDSDGDGTPNGQDDYPYGSDPTKGGGGEGDARMAGKSGSKAGGSGQDGQGAEGTEAGSQGQRQVASSQRSSQRGQQGAQQGQSGQQGQQSSQQSGGQQSSSSSQSSSAGGQPGSPSSGSSGGGGNPLTLIAILLKAILGL